MTTTIDGNILTIDDKYLEDFLNNLLENKKELDAIITAFKRNKNWCKVNIERIQDEYGVKSTGIAMQIIYIIEKYSEIYEITKN
tara:strand:+ start:803 stop:1054 length:252 start_codon:yes stop_codon:yes gene_type:complete